MTRTSYIWWDVSVVEQLDLTITPKLSYDPASFLLHEGVKTVSEDILAITGTAAYPLLSILGESRTGKTHLGIYLAEQFAETDLPARYFEGEEFVEQLPELQVVEAVKRQILIVDDADDFLSAILPGNSGMLVGLIEQFRGTGGFLLFLRSVSAENYTFDEHLRSRFNAGQEFTIGTPAREEVQELLKALMHQRGLRLPDRKIEYLAKRLNCSVPKIESYLERMSTLARNRGLRIDFPIMSEAL